MTEIFCFIGPFLALYSQSFLQLHKSPYRADSILFALQTVADEMEHGVAQDGSSITSRGRAPDVFGLLFRSSDVTDEMKNAGQGNVGC